MKKLEIRNYKLHFVLCTLYLVLFLSCNKEEPIPAYIHIDKINLTTTSTQGSAANKIVDASVYVDGNQTGIFEMPCTFPVLTSGTHTVKIFPYIQKNGDTWPLIYYPYYSIYQQDVSFTPAVVTKISPSTSYNSLAKFEWLEDFEGAGFTICDTTGTDTTMQKITDPKIIFEGTGCGGVVLSGNNQTYKQSSCGKFPLAKEVPVFLEINYNSNTTFSVGVIARSGTTTLGQDLVLSISPTSGWNKIYIDLYNEVNFYSSATDYSIFFTMTKNSSLAASYFYLDNIKLID